MTGQWASVVLVQTTNNTEHITSLNAYYNCTHGWFCFFHFFRSGSVRNIDNSSQLAHSLEGGRGWCETWKHQTVSAVDGIDCSQILLLDGLAIQIVVQNHCNSFQLPFLLSCFGLGRPVQTMWSDLQSVKCAQIPVSFSPNGESLWTPSQNALHWCFGGGGWHLLAMKYSISSCM